MKKKTTFITSLYFFRINFKIGFMWLGPPISSRKDWSKLKLDKHPIAVLETRESRWCNKIRTNKQTILWGKQVLIKKKEKRKNFNFLEKNN